MVYAELHIQYYYLHANYRQKYNMVLWSGWLRFTNFLSCQHPGNAHLELHTQSLNTRASIQCNCFIAFW